MRTAEGWWDGLYAADEDGDHPMKEFKVGLVTAKHKPVITFW